MKLWHKNIIAIIAGSITGIIFKEQASKLKVIGELFIDITKMISIPLIFFILIKTITDLSKESNIKHFISRSLKAFTTTGAIAILISTIVSLILSDIESTTQATYNNFSKSTLNITNIMNHIFPTNFLTPFIENRVLQVTLLAIFFSYTLSLLPKKPIILLSLISEINDLLFKMLELVIQFTPWAMLTYSAWLASSLDTNLIIKFSQLLYIILITYIILLLILGIYIKFVIKLNPLKFFLKSLEYQVFAFSTGSSKASLSFTLSQSITQLGISPTKANLLIPLGASLNMTGLAAYLSASAIFLAKFYNIELDLVNYLTIFTISFISPIGAAGLPCGALLIIPMLLSSIGIPFEALVLMTSIEPLVNGIRTAVNITGDVGISLIIDKQDKELNENIYNR